MAVVVCLCSIIDLNPLTIVLIPDREFLKFPEVENLNNLYEGLTPGVVPVVLRSGTFAFTDK
jgi:hypothetical protein